MDLVRTAGTTGNLRAILHAAQIDGIAPKAAHDTFAAQQAVYLVAQHAGIAIFADPPSLTRHKGVVIKPLTDKSLSFETCLIMRTDQDCRRSMNMRVNFSGSTPHSWSLQNRWICRYPLDLLGTSRRIVL